MLYMQFLSRWLFSLRWATRCLYSGCLMAGSCDSLGDARSGGCPYHIAASGTPN